MKDFELYNGVFLYDKLEQSAAPSGVVELCFLLE